MVVIFLDMIPHINYFRGERCRGLERQMSRKEEQNIGEELKICNN